MIKRCWACGTLKNLEEFEKAKRSKDGRRGVCKDCRREAKNAGQRKYRSKNLEKQAAMQKEWRERNRKHLREYRNEHREKIRNSQRKWLAKPETILYNRKRERRRRENISDVYVKQLLRAVGIDTKEITKQMIVNKRLIIIFRRLNGLYVRFKEDKISRQEAQLEFNHLHKLRRQLL